MIIVVLGILVTVELLVALGVCGVSVGRAAGYCWYLFFAVVVLQKNRRMSSSLLSVFRLLLSLLVVDSLHGRCRASCLAVAVECGWLLACW
jgi:hypothetical protein